MLRDRVALDCPFELDIAWVATTGGGERVGVVEKERAMVGGRVVKDIAGSSGYGVSSYQHFRQDVSGGALTKAGSRLHASPYTLPALEAPGRSKSLP